MTIAKALKLKKRLTSDLVKLVNKRQKFFLKKKGEEGKIKFDDIFTEISDLQVKINRLNLAIAKTNMETLVNGEPLAAHILHYGQLKAELANMEKLSEIIPAEQEGERWMNRRTKDDVELESIISLDTMIAVQKRLEKTKDLIDESIQKANWHTEVKIDGEEDFE